MEEQRDRGLCLCAAGVTREGNNAREYATKHLDQVRKDGSGWFAMFHCPSSDIYWVQDYPHSELHGGGPSRLRRLDVVALEAKTCLSLMRMALQDDSEAALAINDALRAIESRVPNPPRH